LIAATLSRTAMSMPRYRLSSALLLAGGPCPGITIVPSPTVAKFASAARIVPSMLPPVE
jgi:hypothetical protein